MKSYQNIENSYIELVLKLGAKNNIPYEKNKEIFLNAIDSRSRTTKWRHSKSFDKIHKELMEYDNEYKQQNIINEIMVDLCLA